MEKRNSDTRRPSHASLPKSGSASSPIRNFSAVIQSTMTVRCMPVHTVGGGPGYVALLHADLSVYRGLDIPPAERKIYQEQRPILRSELSGLLPTKPVRCSYPAHVARPHPTRV